MKNLFVNLSDLKDIRTFYRISCKTCRDVEIMDENGKPVHKKAVSNGAILEEITTKSGNYNCGECMTKILKNPYYDKEVETERIMGRELS